MRCCDCPFYVGGWMWNECKLTKQTCFRPQQECAFVNVDGTPNEERLNNVFCGLHNPSPIHT